MRAKRDFIAKLQVVLMLLAGAIFIPNSVAIAVPPTTTTASTVSSQNNCVWWYEDFPADITLKSAGDGAAKYEGLDLLLTDDSDGTSETDIKFYISGNSVEGEPPAGTYDSNTECTWYRTSLIEGIEVLVDIDSTAVTSTDGGLNFGYDTVLNGDLPDESNGLRIQITPDGSCDGEGYWSTGSDIYMSSTLVGNNVATVLGIPPKNKAPDEDADRCKVALSYSLVIPGDMLPDNPGTSATFTLPGIVWSVNTPLVAP